MDGHASPWSIHNAKSHLYCLQVTIVRGTGTLLIVPLGVMQANDQATETSQQPSDHPELVSFSFTITTQHKVRIVR